MDKMREEFEEWARDEYPKMSPCYFEWVNEYSHYAIDEVQFAWEAWQAASAQPSDEQSSVVAHPADNIDTIKEDRDRNERMFLAACQTLAQISDALGLDSDDSDPESLLDAIAELKSAQPVAAIDTSPERVEKYCENRHDCQPAGEAVAWRVWRGDAYELFFNKESAVHRGNCFVPNRRPEPLYTAPPEQVLDGWQIVPMEPTPQMLKAIDQHGEYYSDESLKDAYKDMLAAAIRARGNKH